MPARRAPGPGACSESAALVRSTEGMAYTEEGGSMLGSSGPPLGGGVGGGGGGGGGTGHDLEDDFECRRVSTDISLLSQFHEDAIRQAGFGYFQWMLMLVAGLGLATDSVELFVIPYILPSAEVELCITGAEKSWLLAITLLGMAVGGVVWGDLADRMGRRRTLLSALSVNAVFSVIAALMPTYGTFMTARFCSGVGIGGSLPVVLAYYSEFLSKADRGRYLSWLLMFWALGGVFAALIGWLVVPRTGAGVVVENKEHFSAWHQYLLLCSLPSIAAVICLSFVPESPRYLLEAGREVEAMMVYQRIYKTNNMHNPASHAQYQLSELELPSKRPNTRGMSAPSSPGKSVLADMTYSIETFWNSFLQLFLPPHLRVTAVLVVLWFAAAFGYYGLTLWFPEYIKLLKERQYQMNRKLLTGEEYNNFTFSTSVENVRWNASNFTDGRFNHLTLSHVTFDNCSLENVEFANIQSSRTYFRDSVIKDCKFVDTDLKIKHFEGCELINNTFIVLTTVCQLDFDYNIHLEDVFQENLVGQLSLIPGAFLSAFVVDRLGRVKVIGLSMFLSSVAAIFIWFLESGTSVIIFEAIFNFIFIAGWNAIDISTIESYPTHLRTTGYGLLSAVCRVGGLVGVATLGGMVAASRAVPMLTTAAVLLIGGIISVKLPESSSVLL
ncbi:synaptic vesicle glycoprotein 2B [Anabrus simplex]|uniref:synaptic vesicle glycoprotein 2B n=1 Tax=Anabrus simplex TaxID=316456 RepID=UPI0035A294EE